MPGVNKRTVLRTVLGMVFLFSGIAKALNPFGFSVKAGEYLAAMHLDFLLSLQPVLGVGIPALEIALGLFLLFAMLERPVSVTVLILTAGFTLLTFWDMLFDPVGDCGCFGDVLKLSPLTSFLKNVVLLVIAVCYFRLARETSLPDDRRLLYSRILSFTLCSVAFPLYVYRHLPLYDVSGYTAGTVLVERQNGPGVPADGKFDMLYRNRFTDEICTFSLEDSQWQDSTVWEFVGINGTQGISPLPMLREDFTDVSQDVLSTSDSLLLVVIQNPSYVPDLSRLHIRPVALSAYDIPDVKAEHYSCDYSLLRQIIPNPKGGALLVHDGVILDKWAMCDCPYLD